MPMRPRYARPRRWRALSLLGGLAATPVLAQTVNVPNGLPQTPIAVYQELDMGGWTPATVGGTTTVGTTGTPASSGGTTTSGSSLSVMNSQSWGYAAGQNASALGVNPDALAATCVMESGCTNITTTASGSTITGAFQMSNGTYTQAMQEALASNPTLAASLGDTSLSGQTDPATQAVAAAQYLKDAATSLQSSGIGDPTALDTRAYYNFGPVHGAQIATADDNDLMASYVPSSQLSGNGITPGETVGQWKATVAAKMGSSANSPVLTS
ncbi:hypothetical protein [Kozakia baliensis]|uniref:hypothetical protein n=1 Tax=Kozakia baliensis TaxID=153496 RepID=UPI0038D12866